MMMKRSAVIYYAIIILLALIVYGWYDYSHGLTIMDAQIVSIIDDPKKPDGKALLISVLSDFPEYPLVSDNMRFFFRLQPTLCFIKPDGAELVNDDVLNACFIQKDDYEQKGKLHRRERSEFLVRFYQVQTDPNGKRDFYKSMVQNKGLWAKFQLVGFFIPPTVESKPFFLSLTPYCKTQPEHCKRVFGW